MIEKVEKEISIIKSDPILILTLPIAFFILIIFNLIKKIILIRFGFLHSDRIGHFAANTELFLCEEKKFSKIKNNILDFYYFPTNPCNKQLAKMIERKKTVIPRLVARPFCLIARRFKFLKDHVTGRSIAGDYDIYNLLDEYPSQLNFTKQEELKGNAILDKMGIKKKFVCLIVRDNSYLKKKFTNSNFSYHDHRDDKIQKYKKAVNFLILKGYYVLRMGNVTKNKLNVNNKKYIDYSRSKFKSDFMDIYLGAKCHLCISNNTGYDALPLIFRRPILHIDSIPMGCISTFSKNIYNTIACHYSLKKKRKLKMSEIFKMNLAYIFQAQKFKKKSIRLIKMSPKEIKSCVSEVLNHISNKNRKKNSYQKKFIKNFEKNIKIYDTSKKYHGKIKSIFLKTFIKKNPNLLN